MLYCCYFWLSVPGLRTCILAALCVCLCVCVCVFPVVFCCVFCLSFCCFCFFVCLFLFSRVCVCVCLCLRLCVLVVPVGSALWLFCCSFFSWACRTKDLCPGCIFVFLSSSSWCVCVCVSVFFCFVFVWYCVVVCVGVCVCVCGLGCSVLCWLLLLLLLLLLLFFFVVVFVFERAWTKVLAPGHVVVAVSVKSQLPGLRSLMFCCFNSGFSFCRQGDGSLCRALFHSGAAFKLFGLGPAPFIQAGACGKFPCRTPNLLGRMWTQCRGSMMRSVPSSVS